MARAHEQLQEDTVPDLDEEAEYLLRCAHEEREQAVAAQHPSAATVHRALAERYATRAFLTQMAGDEPLIDSQSPIGRSGQSDGKRNVRDRRD
ncbi:hypothetical protein [Sphingomonas crocodyli]|uniref:Uncharacterized protein n=1 Tax=Sphingomonas crocodyli TaxID=1979270 RepID=A0A437LYB4_9SPHN|nr:hypothetical protein [Sphingomonas crocodyli]RVT90400.1 hypothetical protein EOD43_19245 [Sphingomonas crocodyli]